MIIHHRIRVSPVRPTLRLFAMAMLVPVARAWARIVMNVKWRIR